MSKSTEVLRICKEKGIRMIDFKMTDLNGRWRHITIPVERFDEEIFPPEHTHSSIRQNQSPA